MIKFFVCCVALIVFGLILISAEDKVIPDPDTGLSVLQQINENSTEYLTRRYCYRFTWLGPKYNNESVFKNATCEDVVGGAPGVPCNQPLVVTDNEKPPDTNWMWNNFKTAPNLIACRLAPQQVCARMSYSYNNIIENITYMCTQVTIAGGGAAPLSCYKEKINATGRTVEVCACESRAGSYPCNLSSRVFTTNVFVTIFLMVFLYNLNLANVIFNLF